MTGMALKPLVAACLLATLSTAVQAAPAPYSTIVVFGDSLSDAGQFPDPGGPAGSTMRFTNRVGPTFQNGSGEIFGPVTPTLLGGQLGIAPGELAVSTSPVNARLGIADGNNWAVGGYRTDQIFDSITAPSGSVVANGGITLRSRDGYLVDRASQGLGADPNALYYLTGGGNDFLQGRILNQLQAQQAAGRLVDSVEALQQAGARYIMVWLLPDLGLTPATFGTVQQSFASQLSASFNATLTAQLSQVPANIIPLNIPLLVGETLANPSAYGLASDQNLVGTCFSGNGCIMNPTFGLNGTTPDPTRLLFNDSVHPTIAGQRLIADYAYSLLAAPWEVTLLPEMAHGTLRAYQDELRNQWQADWERWQGVGQWRAFVAGGGQHLDFDSQDSAASGDGNGYNLTLGGSYRIDDAWRAGVAAGFFRQDLEAGAEDSEYQLNSYLASAFVQYQQNRWWADAALTGGYLDYDDLKRKFALGGGSRSEKGDTDGHLWAFSARLGYDIAQQADSPWHLSPFISADYARVEVDGYAEDGASSTALDYDDQKRDSRRLGAGLQGKYAFGADTQVFAEYAHEREYEDDNQDLTLALNSLPGNRFTLEGFTPQDHLDRVSLGFSQQLAPDLSLRGGYSWRKGEDDTQQGVSLALSLDF
ncbi:autotransporter domain-containing protein [Pseudomonas sp. BN417]|uniref:esterase EstP n=1 Tax=Pseudomonas sp. BN417 TaxID=2567890 RepID=UPI002456619A|nr:esterase EstP [Pseudomonas sp. BN417]MDH4554660.1 autotransporter domain-containing protein [Pseudomonas sp. BN417]